VDCNSLKLGEIYLLNKAFPQEEFQHIIANLAIKSGTSSPDQNSDFSNGFEIDDLISSDGDFYV
jgi:hypothetical protein